MDGIDNQGTIKIADNLIKHLNKKTIVLYHVICDHINVSRIHQRLRDSWSMAWTLVE